MPYHSRVTQQGRRMQPSIKPFSQSCENNKQVIFERIKDQFQNGNVVLEIGSRTAQHVMYFSSLMPTVRWLPSDIPENMATLKECRRG